MQNISYKHHNSENYAIKNINLQIGRGEFITVIGHNGCGKSTFAKHINGLLKPTEGNVFINGINTKEDSKNLKIKQTVGMIFQNPDNQIVASTVEEEIAFGLENICMPSCEMPIKIRSALQSVGLCGFENRNTCFLSGGQKQRLAIASVLAMNPEILVLDEPTSMLDPEGKKNVMDAVASLNAKGLTIVMITHSMREALTSQRTLVMNKGEFVMSGKSENIFSDINFIKSHKEMVTDSTDILYFLKNRGYDVSLKAFDEKSCANEIIKLLELSK